MRQPTAGAQGADQPQLNEPPLQVEGVAAHWDHRIDSRAISSARCARHGVRPKAAVLTDK
ncbi:hypothetical protein [Bradyrhizobium sp. URHD0069]|uniref:hypothetical protein n=1 Tax=Bradyrhizobium sp. URHD0069 TaxID=1380355 RepID=UPI000AFC3322|nr:hypothetical protein [Bradyrhizobium sp. URHD0069]